MKLKLDLHTHCLEATRYAASTEDVVKKVVARIKDAGLDGIAITDHYAKDYAFQFMRVAQEVFADEVIIIPGQEVERIHYHLVELYLPGDTIFRFVAHPGLSSNRWPAHLEDIHGLEVDSPQPFNREHAKEVAQKHGLLLLCNSDAHTISEIGQYYNEIDFEELCARGERIPVRK